MALATFLEFADGFFEQTHLAIGDAQIVVGFEVFAFGRLLAQIGAKLVEHVAERTGS